MNVRWDDWELDMPARRLTGAAGPVHVEPQVFDVLAYLVKHRERVVPKAELLDEIWGDQFVSESALTTRIKSVRRALGDDGRAQRYIRNVHGHGYQFVGAPAARTPGPMSRPAAGEIGGGGIGGGGIGGAIALDDEFPFVGRRNEIERVENLSEPPIALTVFIGGEPGIGKSRLAVELLSRATALGAIVCAGRCEEQGTFSLQPIRDAIAQLARACPAEFAAWASGLEPQLVALIPTLTAQLDSAPGAVDDYAALDVFATLFERATQSAPTILLVDDVQWSDEPTRTFIGRLTRQLWNRPMRIVCTFRSTVPDLASHVRGWISDHERKSRALRIDLDVLDASASRELMNLVVGTDTSPHADRILQQTRGHGLFLTESLRDLQMGREMGASVHQIVLARFERLPDDVQQLVRAGSVLGSEFSFDLAGAAAGLDQSAALSAIDAAMACGLLHETASPARFRFSHQLIPEAIRSSMSRTAAASFHHRCVAWLKNADADDVDIAHHLLGSVPLARLDDAVDQSRNAASVATSHHQYDRAIRLLDHVLATDISTRTRAEVLLQAGWLLVSAGTPSLGVPRFEEAADLGRGNSWPDIVVEAALGHNGRSIYRKLHDSSTLALLAEANAALGDEPSMQKARVLAKTAVFSKFGLPFSECDRMSRAALDMLPDAPPLLRMELLECRAILLTCPVGLTELESLDRELDDLRSAHRTSFADASTPETALLMRARGAELRKATNTVTDRIAHDPIAEWRGPRRGRSPSGYLTLVAMLCAFDGDLDDAKLRYEEAATVGEQFWGDASYVLHALSHVFLGALGGGWHTSAALLDELLQLEHNQHLIAPAAWAHLASGNVRRGRALAASIDIDALATHGEHILGGNTLVAVAEVALLLHDASLAQAAERHLTPFADLMLGLPWAPSLAAADPLFRLAERRGATREANRHRAMARRVYEALGAPALVARLGE